MGLEGIIREKKIETALPDKTQPCPPDNVNRQFGVLAPDMHWVSDFTYVATCRGFAYVAFFNDAFARRIARIGQPPANPGGSIIPFFWAVCTALSILF